VEGLGPGLDWKPEKQKILAYPQNNLKKDCAG